MDAQHGSRSSRTSAVVLAVTLGPGSAVPDRDLDALSALHALAGVA
jgi:hypothetical protein